MTVQELIDQLTDLANCGSKYKDIFVGTDVDWTGFEVEEYANFIILEANRPLLSEDD